MKNLYTQASHLQKAKKEVYSYTQPEFSLYPWHRLPHTAIKLLLFVYLTINLSGCGTNGQTRSQVATTQAITNLPPYTAIIYLDRESAMSGTGIRFRAKDNNRTLGKIGSGERLVWYRPPGTMKLKLFLGGRPESITFSKEIESGKYYYFKFLSDGYFGGWNRPEIRHLGSGQLDTTPPPPSFQYPQEYEQDILGSDSILTGFYIVQQDITVGSLRIRRIRKPTSLCISGYRDHIQLDGEINEDSAYIINKMLENTTKCETPNGNRYITDVYLNSEGGSLIDGYKIGEAFKHHGVHAKIVGGQVCASACANAFLGAKFRSMKFDGTLLFHAPYVEMGGNRILCANTEIDLGMRKYFSKMLGNKEGDVLFNRTMKYCSNKSGWTINKGAAEIYGLLNE